MHHTPLLEIAMRTRRLFLGLLGLSVLSLPILTTSGARAFEIQPYSAAAAQRAIDSGKTVVLEVYASWCPVCLIQASSIEAVKDQPNYKTISFFRIDYDAQKDVANKLNAPRSTLIVYRGGKEVARESWGPTQQDVTKILMKAAQ
jgi:thiol-disulfide isomerase/thioredoxin